MVNITFLVQPFLETFIIFLEMSCLITEEAFQFLFILEGLSMVPVTLSIRSGRAPFVKVGMFLDFIFRL